MDSVKIMFASFCSLDEKSFRPIIFDHAAICTRSPEFCKDMQYAQMGYCTTDRNQGYMLKSTCFYMVQEAEWRQRSLFIDRLLGIPQNHRQEDLIITKNGKQKTVDHLWVIAFNENGEYLTASKEIRPAIIKVGGLAQSLPLYFRNDYSTKEILTRKQVSEASERQQELKEESTAMVKAMLAGKPYENAILDAIENYDEQVRAIGSVRYN